METSLIKKLCGYASLVCVGLLLGYLYGSQKEVSTTQSIDAVSNFAPTLIAEEREQNKRFTFVSPLLTCGSVYEEISTKKLRTTRDSVLGLISDAKKNNRVNEGSVYFRALNDGGWFGIEESLEFTPGSLLKVPLALSILRAAEKDPKLTTERFTYRGDAPQIPQLFPPAESAEKGVAYSLDELLKFSLRFSDNKATILLSTLVDRTTLLAAYSDLGIKTPSAGDSYTMPVRTYASFFRILYNGTYLSHEASEYVLSLLAESDFNVGLRAGVPADVRVAHKFGEREREEGVPAQLHDCGIVYAPSGPYILCVMLRGNDIKKLPKVISEISKVVYEQTTTKENE
jgi:beta-lactamase class A